MERGLILSFLLVLSGCLTDSNMVKGRIGHDEEALTKPQINLQPLSAVKRTGARLTLSVSVAPQSELNYQWKKDGIELAGATSSE